MNDPNCGSEHCITCSDEGTPMTVMGVDRRRNLAQCRSDESRLRVIVEIALVEPVSPGDRVLVHAGTAIARITQDGVRT